MKEHTELIQKLVKANPKFSGNEDLLEDFCSETYQKSYLILKAVDDMASLESYMKRVVSSAIIDVLKNNGRLIRTSKGYSQVKEMPIKDGYASVEVPQNEHASENNQEEIVQNNSEEISFDETVVEETIDISTDTVDFDEKPEPAEQPVQNDTYVIAPPVLSDELLNIADPRERIDDQIIRKEILENIINFVKLIDKEKPQEKFLKIFYSRYFLQLKQREIAEQLEISQAEVSKRLVQLSCLIKEKLN